MTYYTITEASKMLKIKVRTVREWIRKGRIHAVKLNGSRMWSIPETEIEKEVKAHDNEN